MDKGLFNALRTEIKEDFLKLQGGGAPASPAKPGGGGGAASAAPSPQKQPAQPQRQATQTSVAAGSSSAGQSPQKAPQGGGGSAAAAPPMKSQKSEESSGGFGLLSSFSKNPTPAQPDNDVASKLRREIIERDQRIEALSENLKLMMTSQENLERQVEAFKMQAKDTQPLISTKDSDRVQDLEARVMEQKQRIIQLEDANKRLRTGGAKEGGIPEERILKLQEQVSTLFDDAAFVMSQSAGGAPAFAAPPAEPLLNFSQPAHSLGDPFDLLGLNEVPVMTPVSPTNAKKPAASDLEKLKQDVVDAVRNVIVTFHESGAASASTTPQGSLIVVDDNPANSEFVENLKAQITMWKDTAQKRAEALAQTEISQAEKIAGIQRVFEEEIIFKDAEIANLRKLTVTKIDEKKLDYEPQYRETAAQLFKQKAQLQEVSSELSKQTQENAKLHARITTLETDAKNSDVARSSASEQSTAVNKRIAALEEDIKQKKEQLTTVTGTLESTKTTLNAMSAKANTLREEKKELNDRYTEALEKLSSLEKVANSRKQDTDSISREKDTILNKLHDATTQLEALKTSSAAEIEKLKREHDDALEQLDLQLSESRNKEAATARELKDAKALVASLQEKNAELEGTIAARDAEIEQLKTTSAAEAERMKEETAKKDEEMEQLRQAKETDQKAIDELQFKVDNFDADKKAAEKKSQQMIKDLKKQLAEERKGGVGGSVGGGPSTSSDVEPKYHHHREKTETLGGSEQMKADLDDLVTKVTSLQSEIMDLRRENRNLGENIEVLRADNEAKSKIVQEYLMKEKVGIIGPASFHSTPSSGHLTGSHKEEEASPSKSRLASLTHLPGNLVRLPSEISHLSPLTSKKKASAQLGTVTETNKKLQDVVEETMMKNMQLQELIKNMGEEIATLKGQLKEKKGGDK